MKHRERINSLVRLIEKEQADSENKMVDNLENENNLPASNIQVPEGLGSA